MKDGSRRWLLVALLWVVACLNYLDRQVIFTLFPLLRADLGLTNIELGLVSTVFLWVYAILSPFTGFLADRFGRERIIIISLFVWSAVTWATSLCHSAGTILLARGFMGLSEACYLPAALALINDHHGDETRSRASGLHQSGTYFGAIAGGTLGGWVGERYGWRTVFLVLGLFGILYALVLIPGLRTIRPRSEPPTSAHAPSLLSSMRELWRLPGFGWMTVVFGLSSVAGWMLWTWLPLYVYEQFHTGLAEAGFTATAYIQAGSFAGILLGGWLSDRWSRRNPRARFFTQAFGFLASAPFLFVGGGTSVLALLCASLVIFGLGRGFYDCNIMPLLCGIARPELRATGYGIFNLVGNAVGGATAVTAGVLKDSLGLGGAIRIGAVVWFLCGVVLLSLAYRQSKTPTAAFLTSSSCKH